METVEGNVLIAFFMGAEEMSSSTTPQGVKTINSFQLGDIYCRSYDAAKQLKYHTSFDWLRPVFDKWVQLPNHPNESVQALRDNYTARIAHKLAYESCESAASSMAIAINWYNANK